MAATDSSAAIGTVPTASGRDWKYAGVFLGAVLACPGGGFCRWWLVGWVHATAPQPAIAAGGVPHRPGGGARHAGAAAPLGGASCLGGGRGGGRGGAGRGGRG